MTDHRPVTEHERLLWRILDYVFHCEGKPLEDCQPLNQEQSEAWNELHHNGALEFGSEYGSGQDQWRITQIGRAQYYKYRGCQVEGCPYVEVRGSREGDFVDGHFVCPAHATSIGDKMARDQFSGGHLIHDGARQVILFGGDETPAAPPSLEDLARARNEAAKEVRDWMEAEGRAGNLRYNDQAPGWPRYKAAQEELNNALSAVGLAKKP